MPGHAISPQDVGSATGMRASTGDDAPSAWDIRVGLKVGVGDLVFLPRLIRRLPVLIGGAASVLDMLLVESVCTMSSAGPYPPRSSASGSTDARTSSSMRCPGWFSSSRPRRDRGSHLRRDGPARPSAPRASGRWRSSALRRVRAQSPRHVAESSRVTTRALCVGLSMRLLCAPF
jgi:hypothetical protein